MKRRAIGAFPQAKRDIKLLLEFFAKEINCQFACLGSGLRFHANDMTDTLKVHGSHWHLDGACDSLILTRLLHPDIYIRSPVQKKDGNRDFSGNIKGGCRSRVNTTGLVCRGVYDNCLHAGPARGGPQSGVAAPGYSKKTNSIRTRVR